MFCPNCGNNCGDANFCSNCGNDLKTNAVTVSLDSAASDAEVKSPSSYEKYKVKGNKMATIAAIRKDTGMSLPEAVDIADELFSGELPPARTWERETKKRAEMDASGQVYCPKCLSTSISANKKGFGIGKAVVGAAAFGRIGLAAGNIGAKKVICTCLKCGYQWNAGKK